MGGKKPEGIPVRSLLEHEKALPAHRRKLNRQARAESVSKDGRNYVEVLEDEHAQLADADTRYRGSQSANAQKLRSQGADGRTMSQLVADVARKRPDDDTSEKLWPHMQEAIAYWAGDGKRGHCEEITHNGRPAYEYTIERSELEREGKKPLARAPLTKRLTFKRFGELFRAPRAAATVKRLLEDEKS